MYLVGLKLEKCIAYNIGHKIVWCFVFFLVCEIHRIDYSVITGIFIKYMFKYLIFTMKGSHTLITS